MALRRAGQRLGARGTVFCVGQELGRPGARAAVRALAEGGHEIANHSWSHDYRLWRRGPAEAAEEIRRGGEAVAEAAGRPARGFRAPGYALSPAMLAGAGGPEDGSAPGLRARPWARLGDARGSGGPPRTVLMLCAAWPIPSWR
ncbi:MAG TPA: polysaccharide deacetylase family protein [Anaeromyxobacteraceae bacterium]